MLPKPLPEDDDDESSSADPVHTGDEVKDEGLLESIGEAISAPVRDAAEDDEAEQTGEADQRGRSK